MSMDNCFRIFFNDGLMVTSSQFLFCLKMCFLFFPHWMYYVRPSYFSHHVEDIIFAVRTSVNIIRTWQLIYLSSWAAVLKNLLLVFNMLIFHYDKSRYVLPIIYLAMNSLDFLKLYWFLSVSSGEQLVVIASDVSSSLFYM